MTDTYKKVGIVGFGPKTGYQLFRFLEADQVWIFDQQQTQDQKTWIQNHQKPNQEVYFLEDHPSQLPDDLQRIWISPGVSLEHPLIQQAKSKGIAVESEIDLAGSQMDCPIVAITGSLGKSTLAKLCFDMFKEKYQDVFLGGNYGTPLIEAVGQKYDIAIVEVSSFQLEASKTFAPHIAIFLNFYENHLDRHHDLQTYFEAKKNIFQNQNKNDHAIINTDHPWLQELTLEAKRHSFSSQNKTADLYLHNLEKAHLEINSQLPIEQKMASLLLAKILNIETEVVQKAWETFDPLPFRMQTIATKKNKIWINDSKSTTPDSTLYAISQLTQPLILILGGRNKNANLQAFAKRLTKFQNIKKIYLFGEVGPELGSCIQNQNKAVFNILDEVFKSIAETDYKADQAVLFSPGFASFDQYQNMIQRGEHFNNLVNQIQ